jgi:hypothetical protein
MKRDLAELSEGLADGVAALSFGGAVALFVYHVPAPLGQHVHGAFAGVAALIAYAGAKSLLGLVEKPVPFATVASLELPSERKPYADSGLDSPVVVRLFDPAEAAESQSNHWTGRLPNDLPPDASRDASESLHEALNQLRRSLANRR